MRIAVFTNQFPSPINTFFARDLRSLAEGGCEVHVCPLYPETAGYWANVPAWLGDDLLPRDQVHHLSRAEVAQALGPTARPGWPRAAGRALPFVTASARFGPAAVLKSAYAAAAAESWSRRLASIRFEHVIAYWGNYTATAAHLFHRRNLPTVPFSMFTHARVDLYRHPAGMRRKLLYADNIFTVCEYNRRYLATQFADIYDRIRDRIHIHHLGVDLEEYPYRPENRPAGRIVVATRFEPHKGVHVVLEAAARLVADGRRLAIDVLGDGPEAGRLRRQAAGLGLGETVRFHGIVPPDAARRFMAEATILAHAPLADDAMPTIIKECLALGTPVVASDSTGIPEMLDEGRCGRLVPPGDAGALARAIGELLDDPAARLALAAAGRAHAEALFDVRRNGRRFVEHVRRTRRASRFPLPVATA